MDPTSLTLLGQAREGFPDAWERFDRLYRPFVTRWLLHRGVNAHDADDLTQEVMAVVVQGLGKFDHNGRGGAFRTWLRGVCLNRLLEHRRRIALRGRPEGGTDWQRRVDELPDTRDADDWDREHDRHVLRHLLTDLEMEFEPTTIAAFRRLALDGIGGAQVAAELKMTPGAAYVAKSRVMRRLRELAMDLLDKSHLQ